MHGVFSVLLIAVLLAALAGYAVMGASQLRRTRRLARRAHELGLRFDAEDPFDMARRYARFAVVCGGHSPAAHNVAHGHVSGKPVRVCDFRYEIGHGTRRITRHYGLIAVELERPAEEVILWHRDDLELAPLHARQATERLGDWVCAGSGERLAGAAPHAQSLADCGASIQTLGSTMLVCLPVVRGRLDCIDALAHAVALAAAVETPADAVASAGPPC